MNSVSALSSLSSRNLWRFVGHNAFINFHGEDCARMSYEQTVYGWVYKPSVLMAVLAPFLFFGPVTQVRELHKIFADGIVRNSRWNTFSSKLKARLRSSNLLASPPFVSHAC
jgi:hypothetical protein